MNRVKVSKHGSGLWQAQCPNMFCRPDLYSDHYAAVGAAQKHARNHAEVAALAAHPMPHWFAR